MQFSSCTNSTTRSMAKLKAILILPLASFGKIEEAKEGQLTFFANPKYEEYLYSTNASIIIINEAYELKQPVNATLIRVPDAYTAFATLLSKYQEIMTPATERYSATQLYCQNCLLWAKCFHRRICLPRRKCKSGQ